LCGGRDPRSSLQVNNEVGIKDPKFITADS
jgi:hypothetical protein